MRKVRLVLDFIKLSIAEKIEFGRNVEGKVKENPKFSTLNVPLSEIKATNDLLEARSVASMSGGKEETFLLHQAEAEWDDLMRKVARDVERIADGDGAVMLNAGFNLAKQPNPGQRPEFSVELGDKPGTIWLRHISVSGAKSYVWQFYIGNLPEHESDWTIAQITTRASVLLEGLTPMSKYWFRVAVVTPQGTSAFSDPIMQVVI